MRDRLFIHAGLVLFVGLATLPFWYSALAGTTAGGPELRISAAEGEPCVAARDYMRRSHMKLLFDWRDGVVRHEQFRLPGASGKVTTAGLTETCLGSCHESKAEFCDSCHSYVSAPQPNCWGCHQETAALEGPR